MLSGDSNRIPLLVPMLLLTLAGSGDGLSARALPEPGLFLWAWEHPQDLRFLGNHDAGVAYLAATLTLAGDRVEFRPRLQPLQVRGLTPLVAVFRLESSASESPVYSRAQIESLVGTIGAVVQDVGVHSVQIDFDAVRSERPFYRDLLWELRRRLPESVSVSMTALASWCIGDRWMTGLPVSEAIPMLFDMGADRNSILHRLDNGEDFREPLCRSSVGIATYDFPRKLPAGRRLYIFHDGPWSSEELAGILKEVRP